jgi:hypothetical protein
MVDGGQGLQGGPLVLRADDLVLAGPGTISNNATLAPRLAGAPMTLGASPGDAFGVDAAELALITGSSLTFGISAPTSNPTGSVLVSAPMVRTNGSLTINTPAMLDIQAALGAPGTVALNVNDINVAAQVSGSTVSIAPVGVAAPATPRPTSLGVETAGALSLTQAELANIKATTLTIGGTNPFSPTSGPISIGAPLDVDVSTLNLTSTGSITQAPGAPIRLIRVTTGSNPQRIGNLDVRSSGTGSGNASIFMTAPNEVPGTLNFDTQGTNNDFDFFNALPMKFQSVGNLGVNGKTRLTSAPFVPLPVAAVPGPGGPNPGFDAQLLAGIDKILDINDALDATSEEDRKKAEEEKKKQQECR